MEARPAGVVQGVGRGHRIHLGLGLSVWTRGFTLLEVYCTVAHDLKNLTPSLETYKCPVQGSEEPAFLITSSKGSEIQLCGFRV